MNRIGFTQSYLMELFNTPSSVLPTKGIPAKIKEDTGHDLNLKTVKELFKTKLGLSLNKRPRKETNVNHILSNIDVIMDLMNDDESHEHSSDNSNNGDADCSNAYKYPQNNGGAGIVTPPTVILETF